MDKDEYAKAIYQLIEKHGPVRVSEAMKANGWTSQKDGRALNPLKVWEGRREEILAAIHTFLATDQKETGGHQ